MRSALVAVLLVSCALPACTERGLTGEPRGAGGATSSGARSSLVDAAGEADAVPASTVVTAATSAEADAGVVLDAGAVLDAGGDGAAPGERAPCPDGMALVQRFCIDRWEAELVTRDGDGGWVTLPPNRSPPADVRFEARTVPDVMPQAYINRIDAAAACRNAGKRLCTMREWRRACEGRGSSHWPYGRKPVAGRCNHEKAHLLSIRYGADPRRWTYAMFNDPSLDTEPGFLAKTGAYEGCATPEGVYDLVGNLHEWVSDTVDADLVERLESEDVERKSQPWRDGNGIFMGGFFSTSDQHGPGCTFTTIAHEPKYHDYSVGFRCCAEGDLPPPPAKTKKPRKNR